MTGKWKGNSVGTHNFIIFDVLMDMFDKTDSQLTNAKQNTDYVFFKCVGSIEAFWDHFLSEK